MFALEQDVRSRQCDFDALVLFLNMTFQFRLGLVHPRCSNVSLEMPGDIDDLCKVLFAFEGVELRETPLLRENRGIKTAFFCALEVAHNLDVDDGGTLERVDCQQSAM